MSKIIRSIFIVVLSITFTASLSSCLTTKTQVGTYKETRGTSYQYSKGKQVWLFWGFLPIGRTSTNTPSSGNCELITRFTLFDILVSGVTFGIVTTYTIKVKAKRSAKIAGDSEKAQE